MRTPKMQATHNRVFFYCVLAYWFCNASESKAGYPFGLAQKGPLAQRYGGWGGRGLVRGASIIRIGLRVWGIINWNRTCYYRGKGRILGFGMRGLGG